MNAARRPDSAIAPGLVASLLLLVACGPCPEQEAKTTVEGAFPVLTGDYLGQTPPGDQAELFAPGIVSTGVYERDMAMTPEGDELYYCAVLGSFDYVAILSTRRENGRWTEPQVAPFSGRWGAFEPALSPDGSLFLFVSFRPRAGESDRREDSDIWLMDRTAEGWSEPYNPGPPVNSDRSEYFPSLTADGTLYFTREGEDRSSRLYRSRGAEGRWTEPESLPAAVNAGSNQFNGYVAPDESYLIYGAAGYEDTFGGIDYYISFRDADDTWTGPINLGERVNTASRLEYSPYVTPDGKYFFFMAARHELEEAAAAGELDAKAIARLHAGPRNGLPDIWWIDAAFLKDLRPAGP
jgi:hypothetical protein